MSAIIRIIEAPSIYLVGRQSVDADELARFLGDADAAGWTTDAPSAGETLVEVGGRLCYESFKRPRPGGNEKYIGHILDVGHGSVLEHAVYTILITGISRSLSHELVRHRVGLSPSQLSQRFVDEGDCAFVVPPALLSHKEDHDKWKSEYQRWSNLHEDHPMPRPNPTVRAETYDAWQSALIIARTHYEHFAERLSNEYSPWKDRTVARKAAREAARSVLPNCVETKICLTGNARAWRHFLEMRGAAGADAEIRRLALALLPVLRAESPNIFGDMEIVTEGGIDVIHTDHRKV